MDFEILQCNVPEQCRNSVDIASEHNKCYICRLAPGNESYAKDFWRPKEHGLKHPTILKEKADKKLAERKERIAHRQNRDKSKMKLSRKAVNSEREVSNKVIKATRNSGRTFMDGDFSVKNFITLDNKLQTTRVNPEVDLAELEKVNLDAERAKNLLGGLVITNKHGVAVIVFKLEDFSREILSRL
jgi:hypothetical protein